MCHSERVFWHIAHFSMYCGMDPPQDCSVVVPIPDPTAGHSHLTMPALNHPKSHPSPRMMPGPGKNNNNNKKNPSSVEHSSKMFLHTKISRFYQLPLYKEQRFHPLQRLPLSLLLLLLWFCNPPVPGWKHVRDAVPTSLSTAPGDTLGTSKSLLAVDTRPR